MSNKLWSMKMNQKPGITRWDLGPHFVFWDGNEDDSMQPMPLFSSPHADILEEDETTRACMRLKTLIRLANGISLTIRGEPLHYLDSFYYHKTNTIKHANWNHDPSIIMNEFICPFDENVIKQIESTNTTKRTISIDYAELVVKDPFARDLMLFLSLALEDELYMLINMYKIIEIIEGTVGKQLSEDANFNKKYKFESYRQLNNFSKYMNTKKASGTQSRHGFSKEDKKAVIKIPTYNKLVDISIKAVSEWMSYKCDMEFMRKYPTSKGLTPFGKDPDKYFDL